MAYRSAGNIGRAERTLIAGASSPTAGIVFTLFFLSGVPGLVYEVAWMRMLTLLLGGTTLAVSSILTAFMGGLALGSFVGGRMVDRSRNALRWYAALEAAVGIYGLLFPWVVQGAHWLYLPLFRALGDTFVPLAAPRFLLTFALLLFPTTLMGATVPILIRVVVRGEGELGQRAGLLYALNTAGGVAGVLLAGFVLLPAMGFRTTTYLAAFLNLAIAGAAWVVGRQAQGEPVRMHRGQAREGRHASEPPLGERTWLPVLVFALSGFCALAYEVIWTRLLILNYGSSVYAFSLMLGTFLSGLVVGSLAMSVWVDRFRHWRWVFGILQGLIGASVMLLTPLLGNLPELFLAIYQRSAGEWHTLVLWEFLLSATVLMVPSALFGATFPVAVRMYAPPQGAGARVGLLYAANTLGAIGGSLLSGLLLLPILGLQRSLAALAFLNGGLGAVCWLTARTPRMVLRAGMVGGVVAILVLGVLLFPPWDPRVLYSGVYVYAPDYVRAFAGESLADKVKPFHVLFHKDGASASVSVMQGTYRFLRINGKTDAGHSPDMQTQRLLAHIPLLLHPAPRDVLVIGLGSGVTLGTALQFPLASADVAEISPEVVEASTFFEEANHRALADPRVTLRLVDGRTWVMAGRRPYDVIISEPSNPWQTGNSNLFTREHYAAVRASLNPRGIFCQWFPYYRMTTRDLQTGVKTFATVFPHTTIWLSTTDALLIGSLEPLALDLPRIRRRMEPPSVRRTLEEIGISDLSDFLKLLWLDEGSVARFVAETQVPLHTDDHPVLEFSGPKTLYLSQAKENLAALEGARMVSLAALLASESLPEDRILMRMALAERALARGRIEEAAEELHAALAIDPAAAPAHRLLGTLYGRTGEYRQAEQHLLAALQQAPDDAEAHHLLGQVYVQQGRFAEAYQAFGRAIALRDDLPDAHYNLGVLLFSHRRDLLGARAAFERALQLDPRHVEAYNALAAVLTEMGDVAGAKRALQQALAFAPQHERARRNLDRLQELERTRSGRSP